MIVETAYFENFIFEVAMECFWSLTMLDLIHGHLNARIESHEEPSQKLLDPLGFPQSESLMRQATNAALSTSYCLG